MFMNLMNGVFHTYLDQYVIIFLDDILIYSKTMEDHEVYLCQVLQCLRDHQLYENLSKRVFFQLEVKYLGHIITNDGIVVDLEKIHAIMDWLVPTNVSKVFSSMGLVGYYSCFMKDFSQVAHPITSLQQKGKKYVWSDQYKEMFNSLKECLTNTTVSVVPNLVADFMVCTDASLEGMGAMLMQDGYVKDHELNYPLMIQNLWSWCMLQFIGDIFFWDIGLSCIAII